MGHPRAQEDVLAGVRRELGDANERSRWHVAEVVRVARRLRRA